MKLLETYKLKFSNSSIWFSYNNADIKFQFTDKTFCCFNAPSFSHEVPNWVYEGLLERLHKSEVLF